MEMCLQLETEVVEICHINSANTTQYAGNGNTTQCAGNGNTTQYAGNGNRLNRKVSVMIP